MSPLDLIEKYYPPGSLAYRVLIRHSGLVAEAAVKVAGRVPHLLPDAAFIWEAAMLHDIGIFYTYSPEIGCFGQHPYLSHGYLGRALLEEHGLPRHALVCERHVGSGFTAEDIKRQNPGLPQRDMLPETVEEQIICFADSFFSKTPPPRGSRKTAEQVAASLERYGRDKTERFSRWLEVFGSVA
ncbi:MAG: HD domain-containing protein [Thermodesulfobacteriota bacterium]